MAPASSWPVAGSAGSPVASRCAKAGLATRRPRAPPRPGGGRRGDLALAERRPRAAGARPRRRADRDRARASAGGSAAALRRARPRAPAGRGDRGERFGAPLLARPPRGAHRAAAGRAAAGRRCATARSSPDVAEDGAGVGRHARRRGAARRRPRGRAPTGSGRSCVTGSGATGPAAPSGVVAWRGVVPRGAELDALEGETWGSGLLFGAVGLAEQRVYWFASLRSLPSGASRDAVRERRGCSSRDCATGRVPAAELVARTDPDAVIRTPLMERAVAAPLARGRAALLGDAAHPMLPNIGQGGCQAIEDAVELAAALAGAPDRRRRRWPGTTACAGDAGREGRRAVAPHRVRRRCCARRCGGGARATATALRRATPRSMTVPQPRADRRAPRERTP